MPVLLHLDSSPMGEGSITRHLTREFVKLWQRANPGGLVVARDLARTKIPVIDAEWVAANYTPPESRTDRQHQVLALSTELTDELLSAGECVIGIPMHNWGPSSSFKLWVDQVVRFGKTLALTPSGMQGTLGHMRVTLFVAAGRNYGRHSPDAARNHLEPWLRTFFANLGVRDLHLNFVDGTVETKQGRIDREAFLAPHLAAMQSFFAEAVPSSTPR
jgi:FMN-dependent NADH-azoreductase